MPVVVAKIKTPTTTEMAIIWQINIKNPIKWHTFWNGHEHFHDKQVKKTSTKQKQKRKRGRRKTEILY